MMTEGLIATFEGRIAICLIAGGLGLAVSILLTFAAWVISGLTGVRHRSIGKWFLGFGILFVAPSLLALIMVTGFELTAWFAGNLYLLPIIAAVLASVLVAVVAARRGRKARTEPPVAVGMPPVAQGWSMPTDAQWDR